MSLKTYMLSTNNSRPLSYIYIFTEVHWIQTSYIFKRHRKAIKDRLNCIHFSILFEIKKNKMLLRVKVEISQIYPLRKD